MRYTQFQLACYLFQLFHSLTKHFLCKQSKIVGLFVFQMSEKQYFQKHARVIAGNGPFPTFTCGIGIQMENRKIPRLMSRICTILDIIVALRSIFDCFGFFMNPITHIKYISGRCFYLYYKPTNDQYKKKLLTRIAKGCGAIQQKPVCDLLQHLSSCQYSWFV